MLRTLVISELHSVLKNLHKLRKKELKLVTSVFLLGISGGIILSLSLFQNREEFMQFLAEAYSNILQKINKLDFISFFTLIYFQNLKVVALTIFLGLLYKYLPLLTIFVNSLFIGLVLYGMVVFGRGIAELGLLIPHGIFEIPAFLLSAALGIHLSNIAKTPGFKGRLQALVTIRKEVFFIALLLLIAAAIESLSIILFK